MEERYENFQNHCKFDLYKQNFYATFLTKRKKFFEVSRKFMAVHFWCRFSIKPRHFLFHTSPVLSLLQATRTEAEQARVESFIPQSYVTFEQGNISKNTRFFDITYGTKKIILVHIIDIPNEPARPRPAVTLFDGLFLSQFKRYKL